jgi:crotonobetainyl-CoA:carnitine CoA-transferase CaiB-like acyl-CoA transferase
VKLTHPKYGDVDDVYGMGMPLQFSDATVGFDQPPPSVGEHNEAIYQGLLGYSAERMAQLRQDGVI